jgi:hypothetical protein
VVSRAVLSAGALQLDTTARQRATSSAVEPVEPVVEPVAVGQPQNC